MVLRGIQKCSVRVQSLVANSLCVHVSVWICVEVYIYVCAYVCVYVWGSMCVHICVGMYIYVCAYIVCMCVCTQVEHRPPLGVSSSCTLLYLSLWGESLAVTSIPSTQLYSGPWDPSLDPYAIFQVPTHPATPSTSLLNAFSPAFLESPPRSTTWIQPFKADFWGIKTKNERERGLRIQGTKLGWYKYHFLIALGLTR